MHLGSIFHHLGNDLAHMPPVDAYLALAGILAVEGTGMPLVPFEPLFVATALLVAHHRLGLWPLVLAGAAGDLVGNVGGYFIGNGLGSAVIERYGARLHVGPEQMAAAHRWFGRYGGGTLFIGRFFGPIRTPAILLAGLSRMPLVKYIPWCAAADILWVLGWQLVLLRFRGVVRIILRHFGGPATVVMLAALVLAIAALAWRRWHPQRG
jgi:membrane protein DedA with SNARE-associated domain